ncbi:MAG TPA: substrate-binding domain-containing protein, partial [Anaeromyxobacteraceae bacterium]|nr:substrate-binding domain-containing protein [Anaeromyxobacteraceae bacterium]
MMRSLFLAAALLAPALSFAGTTTVKGSDTMVILAQRWAEAWMKAQPTKKVQVTGGGSGTGIAALINGTTDVATASRAMKPDERAKLKE